MERVTDERIADILDGLIYNKHSVIEALKELQARRKSEGKENVLPIPCTKGYENVLPIPCTKGYENWTIKDYFQKINEELDELKEEIIMGKVKTFRKARIADEAADTITAITSMLEAMGIDEKARQEAQERINRHNKERGRC